MKHAIGMVLAALWLAGCNPGSDHKPVLQQERDTLDKARQLNSQLQQQTQQQNQETERQTQ